MLVISLMSENRYNFISMSERDPFGNKPANLGLGPIGEPITRPDGSVLELHNFATGVVPYVDHVGKLIRDEDIIELGEGNWKKGLMRLSQASYSDPKQPYLRHQ